MMQRDNRLGELSDQESESSRDSSMNRYQCTDNAHVNRQARSIPQRSLVEHTTSVLARSPQFIAMGPGGTALPPFSLSSLALQAERASNAFQMPDLYRRSPEMARPVEVTNSAPLATNSTPMEYPSDKVSPGIRTLDSSRRFLLKLSEQSVEKNRGGDAELDMNLPFPVKLHYILSNPKYQDCVAWLPHGRAWRILKAKTFEKKVIPRFFRSAKYASFMRQVSPKAGICSKLILIA
jgi:hypothetical protein